MGNVWKQIEEKGDEGSKAKMERGMNGLSDAQRVRIYLLKKQKMMIS